MAFDGVRYGLIPLIAPIEYAPGAPTVAGAVSKALAGAYCYSRNSAARRIGDQTYRQLNRDPAAYAANAWATDTTWIDIAIFDTRWIPSHATTVFARGDIFVQGDAGPSTVHCRIIATDGTNTDTGATVDTPVARSNAQPGIGWQGGPATPFKIETSVDFSTVTQNGQITINVQAYVTDDKSNAVTFGIGYVCCWWDVVD